MTFAVQPAYWTKFDQHGCWWAESMNHYLAAALLMIVAIGFPMLCAALGMKVNTRNGWWD